MTRLCDFCHNKENKDTGKKILSKDALTYKWKCKKCVETENRKQQYPAEVVR